jgi:hypothetical protein
MKSPTKFKYNETLAPGRLFRAGAVRESKVRDSSISRRGADVERFRRRSIVYLGGSEKTVPAGIHRPDTILGI